MKTLVLPVPEVPVLEDWDRLFIAAKKAGFNAKEDAASFNEWDPTLADGVD